MKKRLLITLLALPSLAYSYCGVPPGPFSVTMGEPGTYTELSDFPSAKFAETSTYWRQCWQSVEIHSFGGEALLDWTNLKLGYQQKYHAALLAALTSASEEKLALLNKTNQSLLQSLTENSSAMNEASLQIKTTMLDQKMDYKRQLQSDKLNEQNYGHFSDGNGEGGIVKTDTQSYKYFKEVCKRNKMFSKTSGAVYNTQRNIDVNKKVTQKSKKMTEVTGSTNEIANAVVQNHASEYCSPFDIKYNQCVNPDLKLCVDNDVDSGVCTVSENEIFKMTNTDTDALNFLRPDGYNGRYTFEGNEIEGPKNRIEDELFDVDFTYTETQKQAAEDFASLLIYQPAVKAPTIAERADDTNSEFVASYNRYLANLNLSNYSFQNSIQARTDLDLEGEIPMSERDVMRYLIHSFGNPDALVAAKSGKDLSTDTMIYQLMTIKNKLDLEGFQQNERIETLLAALLAAQANNPDLINELNSLK